MRTVLTRRDVVRLLGLGTLALACRSVPDPPAPEEIALGRDECAWCRMLIDEERLAAQFVATDGRASSFGEAGCLLAWMAANPRAVGTAFVRTLDTGDWRAARAAHYATGAVRTPMRFDIAAYAAPVSGAGIVDESWDELRRKGAPHARQG
jgi:copper chaperone NosL